MTKSSSSSAKTAQPVNLTKLTYKQLVALEQQVMEQKNLRRETDRAELKERFRAMAEKSGFNLEAIVAHARRRRADAGMPAPVKYRDPRNSQNTWSGRGRPARWLTELEAKGHKRTEFAVAEA